MDVLILAAIMIPVFVSLADDSGFSVGDGKVCSLTEPQGVEGTPLFSWQAVSTKKGDAQKSYRILVSDDAKALEKGSGNMWDSGTVTSSDMYNIAYDGKTLSYHTTYYWTVTVEAISGRKKTSDVFSFSTGVSSEMWTGDWIGFPSQKTSLTLSGAKWIWLRNGAAFASTPQGSECFRFSFTPDPQKTVKDFEIAYTADDSATVYLNGSEISSMSLWSDGSFYRGTDKLTDGKNTIAIKATNASAGYAGVVAKIKVSYTDGSSDTYSSDKTWLVYKGVPSGAWTLPEFDDSIWKTPDQAESFGVSPWGTGVQLRGESSRAATVLRREFTVDKEIKSALLSICGLGFFDLKINGQAPDESVLNPFTTQYDVTVNYRTFDVAELLKKGKNAIGVELGNSYYNEIGGVWNWANAAWRDDPKMMLRLDITLTDGTTMTVVSDTSWKVTQDGPITANSMYYGDVYDARKELTGFDLVGYDDSAWQTAAKMAEPLGKLESQMKAPIERVATFSPASIVKLGEGSWRIESPEMVAGWVKLLNINEESGSKITLTYGQKLNDDGTVLKYGSTDGELASWYPHAYFQQDIYTSAGKKNESYEPKFSYKGFEYVQIDGYSGELTADDVIIYRVSNAVETVSEFDSSNEMFNRLHKSMLVALADNFQGEHCDPMLEKNGWLGDLNVSLTTAMFNYDMSATLPGFIELMEDVQDKYGYVMQMIPTADWGYGNIAVWNTVFIYGVKELEEYYGTSTYAVMQYDEMKKMIVRDINELKANGWVWHDNQLADWVAPMGGSNPDVAYNENVSEGSGIVGTAFVYGALEYMADLAERLGKTADAATYRDAMEKVYDAFNKKFYNSSKGYYETKVWTQIGNRTKYRQTSNLVPLAFGLVPDEYVDSVVQSLVKDIEEKNYHLDTGCVGTRYILPILCDYGQEEVAYRIATQTTYPSWGFWLESDSKSTWEMWENTTRSFDHYFLGTYDEWYFTHLAGIKDVENGYETYTVEPSFIGDLTYVNVKLSTVRGELVSKWEREGNSKITLALTVPFGSTASVKLPTEVLSEISLDGKAVSGKIDGMISAEIQDGKAVLTLGSGKYTVTYTPEKELSVYTVALEAVIAEAKDALNNEAAGDIELKAYVADAEALMNKKGATQSEVNAIGKALADYLDSLEDSEARKELREAVTMSRAVYAKSTYPEAAWSAYRKVLLQAEELLYNKEADDTALTTVKTALLEAETALSTAGYENFAQGATILSSSSHEDSHWQWGKKLLIDGNRKNTGPQAGEITGYCSSLTPTADHAEWIALDFGKTIKINTAVFYSSASMTENGWKCYGFPDSFTIEVSTDNKTWTTVYEAAEYPLQDYGALIFTFEEVEARYIKLNAKSLRSKPSDSNSYRMQISEFEVYNLTAINAVDTATLEKAVEAGEAVLTGNTYLSATKDAQTAYRYALAAAERLVSDSGVLAEEVTAAIARLTAAEEALAENQAGPSTPTTSTPVTGDTPIVGEPVLMESETVSLRTEVKDDGETNTLRAIFVGDKDYLYGFDKLTVKIAFETPNGEKNYEGVLGGSNSDFVFYRKLSADGDSYEADTDCLLFGLAVTDIPKDVTAAKVTLSDPDGKLVVSGEVTFEKKSAAMLTVPIAAILPEVQITKQKTA